MQHNYSRNITRVIKLDYVSAGELAELPQNKKSQCKIYTRDIDGLSICSPQDYLAEFGLDHILIISADQLLGFKQMVLETIHKIVATKYYQQLEEKIFAGQEHVEVFIKFA